MVVDPWVTTTRSAIYFASSVAVAVAPGTPGIGNVTTGLPASNDTDVWPTFATPSAKRVPGLAPNQNVSVVPATAALGAPWGLAQIRTSRSCTVPGIGMVVLFVGPGFVGPGFVGPIWAPGVSSFQAYSPLTTSMFEYVSPFGRVQ